MTPLAWFLAAILVASVACLVVGARVGRSGSPDAQERFKLAVCLYPALVCLILGSMVYYFIGWEGRGSTRVPKELQRRVAHAGYYIARDSELRLVGKPLDASVFEQPEATREADIIRRLMPTETGGTGEGGAEAAPQVSRDAAPERGFFHAGLWPGEHLTLRPVWEGLKAARWTLTYNATNRPLRVRASEGGKTVSTCVNLAEERWLNPGDTVFLVVERDGETRFVSVRWDSAPSPWGPFGRTTNSYHFGQGMIRNGVPAYDKGPDLLMSQRVLNDSTTLSDLVRQARRDFRERVVTIEQQWWEVFSHVTLVRERHGDAGSRIGVLVEDDLFLQSGLGVYKNLNAPTALRFARREASETITIPASATVIYGPQDTRNAVELRLADEVTSDDVWGQIVHVGLANARGWKLPPQPLSDFIITSSRDFIPLDGYLLDVGDSSHSFYAKAHLSDSLDELLVNDGRNVLPGAGETEGGPESYYRRFPLGRPAPLGDYDQGVLLELVSTQLSGTYSEYPARLFGAPYTGLTAMALIFMNALLLVLLALRQRDRPRLFLAWVMVWGSAMTLLTLRLILVYRVSLAPPLDASTREIRNVFNKGVDYSLLGLLAAALLTGLLFWAPGAARRGGRLANWVGGGLNKYFAPLLITWACVVIIYSVAGGLLGTNQSFWGLRISIADHMLIALGLVLLGGAALGHAQSRYRYLIAAVILGALLLQILVVNDAGSIIYAPSLLWCVGAVVGWRKPVRGLKVRAQDFIAARPGLRRVQWRLERLVPPRAKPALRGAGRWAGPLSIPATFFLALLLVPYLLQTGWMRAVVQPHIPDTTFYRFASFTDSEDVILTTRSGEEDADMTKLLDNSRQDWQMLLYASHGADAPAGYGRAPLSKIGMTYSTSVSDCAFSTYLLAEHGKAAGVLLLALYVLLGLVCVVASWHFDDNTRHRSIVLLLVGGFFACNALYMASANVGLLTFTGQNLPLLSLNSGGDLAQGLFLTWLTGWLLVSSRWEGRPAQFWLKHPAALRTGFVVCVVVLVWLVAAGVQMYRLGGDARYRADHDFKPETFKLIERNLPSNSPADGPHRNAPLALTGERLRPAAGGQITELEEQYVKQFNARTDKYNPNGGLYYLERTRTGEARVRINRRFFFARSPFKSPSLWPGQIIAHGESEPAVYALNKSLRISLRSGGDPGSVDLAETRARRTTSAVRLREGGRQFFELTRAEDRVRLDPYRGPWRIYVDGKRLTGPVDLAPLNIIVIEQPEDKYRRNLIYLGPTRPVLAYVRWRNGEQRRMFPEAGFPLAHLLGKAADQTAGAEASLLPGERKLGPELALGIDRALHQTLQQTLARYARSSRNYDPLRPPPLRLAVTVMDAFSGRVLALPSWPLLDPSKPDYERLIDRIPEPTRSRLEDNHNLVGHAVGSTLKPLVFASMATAMWPNHDLARSVVFNRGGMANEGTIHHHTRLAGINLNQPWDCNSGRPESDMRDFIVNSRDYPQGLLGMLGLVLDEGEFGRVLTRAELAPDLSIGGTGYRVNLMEATDGAVAISIQDQRERRHASIRGPETTRRSVLFRQLASLFDFDLSDTLGDRLRRACGQFLPSLGNERLPLEHNEYLNNVVPPRLDMSRGDFQDIRGGYISCLLGGGQCQFSNVMMAEAGARIATGLRVFARIEDGAGTPPDRLPAPLGSVGWRNVNLILPMQDVGEEGTGEALSTLVRSQPQYRAIYKTGTIVEGEEGRESESLMFVVGRWEEGSGFVGGETLAGFLYMEKSKVKNPPNKVVPDGDMKKFRFAAPFINHLITHLATAREERQQGGRD